MGVVVTGTAGLVIWIGLWSLDVSGFDSILIAIGLVLIAVALRSILPNLSDRRDR